jgi:hypothetical protein
VLHRSRTAAVDTARVGDDEKVMRWSLTRWSLKNAAVAGESAARRDFAQSQKSLFTASRVTQGHAPAYPIAGVKTLTRKEFERWWRSVLFSDNSAAER